ncbi:phytanoyl-CoA dioxygenase family protein [Sphingomicrobium aestuariivivum]|uniref:phytanoyl-CoA dioxygenase family protein n=1 Tax=Sphingomicrobium aestuariivivum TaxID=1582356 RepID=UPI001FD6E3E9|nr:phytanoyl-CoA dioxygenase family protein [Sphingomicrobium aestuariivivum]MCJ8191587.1 phytanoyl-CoA dioxygenase family protein [Sphingomicrobium aestuariivivum]
MLKALRRTATRIATLPAILTGAKGFEGASAVASPALNRKGLHRWRVKTAARMVAARRARLADRISAEHRDAFARDGFVKVEEAMPPGDFEAMRDRLLSRAWPMREMVQGDTITRRCAVNGAMLEAVPELARFLSGDLMRGLTRYVAAFDSEPLYYIQAILKKPDGKPDPQTALHADTFHSSMKAWLFLGEVREGEGAFTYVPGSHRVDEARLDWEEQRALDLLEEGDRLSRRGSFRLDEAGRRAMGLPEARELAVPANTLVVADTLGFHARGPSGPAVHRIELWAYSRRNPFLPWTGFDPLSSPVIAPRRVDWMWGLRDRYRRFLKQPWKDVGSRFLDSDHRGARGA